MACFSAFKSFSRMAAAGKAAGKSLLREISTTTLRRDPSKGTMRRRSELYVTMRVLLEVFTMTFLAEWGDRSQFATIILAATKNPYGVIVGGCIGHAICTSLAVITGRLVASKISVRALTIAGGFVFLGFALYAVIFVPDDL